MIKKIVDLRSDTINKQYWNSKIQGNTPIRGKKGLNNRSTYFTYFFKIKVKIQIPISLLENKKIDSINGKIEKCRKIGATPAESTYYQLKYLIG